MRKLDIVARRTETGGLQWPEVLQKVGVVRLSAPVQSVVVLARGMAALAPTNYC